MAGTPILLQDRGVLAGATTFHQNPQRKPASRISPDREIMLAMWTCGISRTVRWKAALACMGFTCVALACAGLSVSSHRSAALQTSHVRIELRTDAAQPRLVRMAGATRLAWNNDAAETLPASVDVGGSSLVINWRWMPRLSTADARHVAFVYESIEPHLRLRWEWHARAGFGPIEHRITIQNLSSREVWLPMVDSLHLNFPVSAAQDLRNLYVEKGADTPSAIGTHEERIADGYNWTGKSTTYAHPVPGEQREIIPAEIVYSANGAQNDAESGWYAGIEFSGRTRISLQRRQDHLTSVLGLDPEPGPFTTRLAPGETFETPTIFLGAFTGGRSVFPSGVTASPRGVSP